MSTNLNNEIWMKASVAGSLWAAFEIVIGSFLHNLHFPFTGMAMASTGVILMVSFSVMWEMKEIFWRAGIVCALMKSISPSAVILGPMACIMLETILMQVGVILLGKNLLGYITGGMLALLSILIYKIINLIVFYGLDFFVILENTAAFFLDTFNLENVEPILLVYIYIVILLVCGLCAASFGYYIGLKARKLENNSQINIRVSDEKLRNLKESSAKGIIFLFLAIAIIISGMFIISNIEILPSLVFTAVFLLFAYLLHPNAFRPLRKPSIFINLILLILFAVFFYDYKNNGISWSNDGFIIGIKMFLRALIIIIGFAVISIELRNPVIKSFMNEKSALYGAVQTGFTILPSLISGLPTAKEMFSKPIKTVTIRIVEADSFINTNLNNKL